MGSCFIYTQVVFDVIINRHIWVNAVSHNLGASSVCIPLLWLVSTPCVRMTDPDCCHSQAKGSWSVLTDSPDIYRLDLVIWEAPGDADGAPGVGLAVSGGSLPRLLAHRAGMAAPVLADPAAAAESQEDSRAGEERPSPAAALPHAPPPEPDWGCVGLPAEAPHGPGWRTCVWGRGQRLADLPVHLQVHQGALAENLGQSSEWASLQAWGKLPIGNLG